MRIRWRWTRPRNAFVGALRMAGVVYQREVLVVKTWTFWLNFRKMHFFVLNCISDITVDIEEN